jgi:hypothetical protein
VRLRSKPNNPFFLLFNISTFEVSSHMRDCIATGIPMTSIFINNKYTRTYYTIIERAKSRTISGYTEKHHVIPKCLGGRNTKDNLAALTAKEHFVAHRLLTKMTEGEARTKMVYALWAMTVHTSNRTKKRHKVTGEVYERIRKEYSKIARNRPPRTKEHSAKLGQYVRTVEIRKAISDARKAQTGKQTRTKETKAKMSAWQKGIPKPKVLCEHCNINVDALNYKRWHGNNCKNYKYSYDEPTVSMF